MTTTTRPHRRAVHLNYHATLGRLGGAAGMRLQATGWQAVEAAVARYADGHDTLTFLTTDDNDHGTVKPHPRAQLVARSGIDKVWVIQPKTRAARPGLDVLRTRTVHIGIDGHSAVGARLRLTYPTGRPCVLWVAQANLGRGETPGEFTAAATRLREAYRGKFTLGLDEIDEGDAPDEHSLLRAVFPAGAYHAPGWGTLVPIITNLPVLRIRVGFANNGMRKVSPPRVITEAVLHLT